MLCATMKYEIINKPLVIEREKKLINLNMNINYY